MAYPRTPKRTLAVFPGPLNKTEFMLSTDVLLIVILVTPGWWVMHVTDSYNCLNKSKVNGVVSSYCNTSESFNTLKLYNAKQIKMRVEMSNPLDNNLWVFLFLFPIQTNVSRGPCF